MKTKYIFRIAKKKDIKSIMLFIKKTGTINIYEQRIINIFVMIIYIKRK